ncbi:hypothetical protein ABL78_1110 [Leptomonas seymouri]|uniref:Uncharacterized protein n=1 Tax=Leptomonas seymouri TaxID=5684 RepID=A0A0N1IB12_LEPSE|nr:hypothetical protein ABL78_1110 [Leptomonas seymouri]|eukprot:KPI89730.1 hypothetical protein ABL78_1110 [Leptomonas seymouri]
MKRPRHKAWSDAPRPPSQPHKDNIAQLATALQHQCGLLVLHPEACVPQNASADDFQRYVIRSLSLVVLRFDSTSQATSHNLHQRAILRGLGVKDVSLSSTDPVDVDKVQTVAYQAVPVSVVVTPWVLQLPSRLQKLVCDAGCFASLGERAFGSADVGPVAEGYLTREAVALVHGLPRCCVEAVSGSFPLFHIPPSRKTARSAETAETEWVLRRTEDVDTRTRDALMKAHLERVAAFQESGLSTLMSSVLYRGASPMKTCWVVLSYRSGPPPPPAGVRDGGPDCFRLRSREASTRSVMCSTAATREGEAPTSVSPLFVLPAYFLCQCLYIEVGWHRIAQQHRRAALDAVEHLGAIIEAIPLCNGDGSVVSAKVVVDLPSGGESNRATLTKASAM